MPSPLECAAIRASVRDAVSDALAGDSDVNALQGRLGHLGTIGGQEALKAIASLTSNGMLDLIDAAPGSQRGGIAGFLQTSADRFGEPNSTICRSVLEAVRLDRDGRFAGESAAVLGEVWAQWGSLSVEHAINLLVLLYDQVGRAQGISLEQAWATAATGDEQKEDDRLAHHVTMAEQRLWDAGFTQAEIDTVRPPVFRSISCESFDSSERTSVSF